MSEPATVIRRPDVDVGQLVQVLHDIDVVKGKVCVACKFWTRPGTWQARLDACTKGYKPLCADDGCDDWRAR